MSSSNPSGFSEIGTGMTIQRMCALCHNPRSPRGSGLRMIAGYKRRVCFACKDAIDARRQVSRPRNSKGQKNDLS